MTLALRFKTYYIVIKRRDYEKQILPHIDNHPGIWIFMDVFTCESIDRASERRKNYG